MTAPTPNQMPGADQAPQPADPVEPPVQSEPAPVAPNVPAAGDQPTPPWGSDEDFNPQRAWNLIQNLRNENAGLKSKAAEAQPLLDAHEEHRRAEQGELATAREDLTAANGRADTWRAQAVRSKAEALAAGRFVDAEVAVTLIGDLTEYAANDHIDVEKLTGRLNQLAEAHPFLLTPPPQQGFTPNRGQGQSGNGPLTAAQVAAHAESQGDMKAAGLAKAEQLINLRAEQLGRS